MMKRLMRLKKACYLISAVCSLGLAVCAGIRGEWVTVCAWVCVLMAVANAVTLERRLEESEILLNMYRREYEKKADAYRDVMTGAERCVICGAVIPEGRMVCGRCERVLDHDKL